MPPESSSGSPARPSTPSLRPLGPIVPAADLGLWADAAAARAGAELYAERTRRWARKAYERARERGLAEGRNEGAAEAARIVTAAQTEVARLLKDIEEQLPVMVLEIVESLLGAFDPGEVLPFAVRKALERLDEASDIRIKVAPDHYEAMKAAVVDMNGQASARRLRVEVDPGLGSGGCVIWSEFGNVEISLDAQLKALRADLTGQAGPPA